MESPQVSYLHFLGAAFVVDPQHAPQLCPVQLLAAHKSPERLPCGLVRVADHERPEGLCDPGHVDIEALKVASLLDEAHRQRGLAPLDYIDHPAVALVCSKQVISHEIVTLAICDHITIELG